MFIEACIEMDLTEMLQHVEVGRQVAASQPANQPDSQTDRQEDRQEDRQTDSFDK